MLDKNLVEEFFSLPVNSSKVVSANSDEKCELPCCAGFCLGPPLPTQSLRGGSPCSWCCWEFQWEKEKSDTEDVAVLTVTRDTELVGAAPQGSARV